MSLISVIIPSYNSAATIRRTLEGLSRQTRPDLIREVIVVDSSGDGNTRNLLARYTGEAFKPVYLEQKTMPGEARNRGAEKAEGDLLLFIDSDAYPAEDWAEKIYEVYQGGCRAGGGAIGLPEEQECRPVPLAQLFLQFNDFLANGKKEERKFAPSCNLFCDKKLFKEAGGFPDIRASEDVLFGLKVSSLADFWFLPDAKVYHIFRESLRSFLRNQVLLGKYILIYRRRLNPKKIYWWGIIPLFLLPGIVLVKGARISLQVLKSGYFFRYFFTLPFFLLGLFAWAFGFIQGVFSNEKS